MKSKEFNILIPNKLCLTVDSSIDENLYFYRGINLYLSVEIKQRKQTTFPANFDSEYFTSIVFARGLEAEPGERDEARKENKTFDILKRILLQTSC